MKYFALFALCLMAVGLAVGQESSPRAEVFGGYSYLNIDTNGLGSRQSANGWEASVSGNFSKLFAAEADVSGHYKKIGLVTVSDYAYVAGPRINLRPVFIHALLGGTYRAVPWVSPRRKMGWREHLEEGCSLSFRHIYLYVHPTIMFLVDTIFSEDLRSHKTISVQELALFIASAA